MALPLVSIVALCYQHAEYVAECLESVRQQTYPNLELIVIDDHSPDQSVEKIQNFIQKYPQNIQFVPLEQNIGNCKAFNKGLALAKGKYIMDLATDDVLAPDCIEKQVNTFEKLPEKYGVVFGNANLIDERGLFLKTFYPTDKMGKVLKSVPEGNIYAEIVRHSFICTPTTLFRKQMLDELGGYDETLSYEDFDIWVRSSRYWQYAFIDQVLLSKRVLKNSLGEGFYLKKHNPHLFSTFQICKKIVQLNRTEHEQQALAQRLRYHVRLSAYTENFDTGLLFFSLLEDIKQVNYIDNLWKKILLYRIPLYNLYKIYRKLRTKIFIPK